MLRLPLTKVWPPLEEGFPPLSWKTAGERSWSSRMLEVLLSDTVHHISSWWMTKIRRVPRVGFEGVRTNPLHMLGNGGIGHGRNEQ